MFAVGGTGDPVSAPYFRKNVIGQLMNLAPKARISTIGSKTSDEFTIYNVDDSYVQVTQDGSKNANAQWVLRIIPSTSASVIILINSHIEDSIDRNNLIKNLKKELSTSEIDFNIITSQQLEFLKTFQID